MATNNSTVTIDQKLHQDQLSDLRTIRRASMAIRSCAEILNEHESNKDCLPINPEVFIEFDTDQAVGVRYAIEACANRITEIFDAERPFGDIGFEDEICARKTKEARLSAKLHAGEISVAEFDKALP